MPTPYILIRAAEEKSRHRVKSCSNRCSLQIFLDLGRCYDPLKKISSGVRKVYYIAHKLLFDAILTMYILLVAAETTFPSLPSCSHYFRRKRRLPLPTLA